MRFRVRRIALVLALACLAPPAAARAGEDRKAEEIFKDYDAIKMPTRDPARANDGEYIEKLLRDRQDAENRRGELARELWRVDPGNERLPKMLVERWVQTTTRQNLDERFAEIDKVKAEARSPKHVAEAAFARANLLGRFQGRNDPAAVLKAIDEFIALSPKDDRGALLLYSAAVTHVVDAKGEAELYRRVVKDFPDSRHAPKAQASLRRFELGKPFALAFTDAICGKKIDVQKDLKGKVVVVDFWATWCGPCVAKMPEMKSLYAKYHDKGVEFLGVSLDYPEDEGGLKSLREFVAKNDIQWPQYYQGNYWDSEFSRSWGIHAIPSMFLVGADGKLVSTEAEKGLEDGIKALLKAEEIVKEYEAVAWPDFERSKAKDPAYQQKILEAQEAADRKRGELAWELYKIDPGNPRLPNMLTLRWIRNVSAKNVDEKLAEIQVVEAAAKGRKLVEAARFSRANLMVGYKFKGDPGPALKALDEYIACGPENPNEPANLLAVAAAQLGGDPKRQVEVYRRLTRDFKATSWARNAERVLRTLENVGKPFHLTFKDAISGKEISVPRDFRGKVVVVDFWATWCGPCIEEMPRMQELYAKYHDRGVEFLGVSLDRQNGGLEALREFVKEKEIPWPQFFQGDAETSKFAREYAVTAIPAVFLVAPDGTLSTTYARDDLEGKIKALLKPAADAVK